MLANALIRLASRQNLSAIDCEQVYGELVRIVGGTRYVNGATTSANGLLDYKNFSPNAGIPNNRKANPASLWPIPIATDTVTVTGNSVTLTVPYIWENINIPSAQAVGWSAMYYGSTSTATVNWNIYRIRQGISMQIGSTAAVTMAATETLVTNQTGLTPVDLLPRDQLQLIISSAGTNTMYYPIGQVWIRTVHVK